MSFSIVGERSERDFWYIRVYVSDDAFRPRDCPCPTCKRNRPCLFCLPSMCSIQLVHTCTCMLVCMCCPTKCTVSCFWGKRERPKLMMPMAHLSVSQSVCLSVGPCTSSCLRMCEIRGLVFCHGTSVEAKAAGMG